MISVAKLMKNCPNMTIIRQIDPFIAQCNMALGPSRLDWQPSYFVYLRLSLQQHCSQHCEWSGLYSQRAASCSELMQASVVVCGLSWTTRKHADWLGCQGHMPVPIVEESHLNRTELAVEDFRVVRRRRYMI
jgi:hypothetical protein